MKRIATLILALGFGLIAFGQNQTLRGTVVDSGNQPIVGAFVVEQGTANGAMTGVDGDFAITTRPGAAIEVSCIGYATQVITNNGEQNVVVVLPDDTQMIEETVVIGYGVQKKSVVTAAIAKVDGETLGITAPTRVDNALKGLTSGVTVTASSGQPGASSRIRIRGVGSINSSDPIYIVDGMPIAGGIDYLNPSDIESIEVLKDAGYDVEPFGETDIQVRAVPFILGKADLKPAFMDTVNALNRIRNATADLRRAEVMQMACKSAVKGGDPLSRNEIEALIWQLLETGAPPTCPHGRPVMKSLSRRELEKMFKRIQ